MIGKRLQRLVNIVLVIVLLSAEVLVLQIVIRVDEVQAQPSGLNAVVGFINIINAANRRRRLYNEARGTQHDMNAYYDILLDEARSQLLEREMADSGRTQVRTYIKLAALLQAERAAVTQQIEAEKNAARQQFNHTLGQQIFNVLIKSPGGQKVLNDVRQTINGLQQAATAVQVALDQGRPYDVLLEQYADSVSSVPLIRNAVRNLGSSLGHKVDQALGNLLTNIETAAENLQEGMQQAIDKADELDGVVAGYQNDVRTPGTIVIGDKVRHVDGPLGAAIEALTNASFIASGIRPDKGTRDTMRDRVRDYLPTQRTEKPGELIKTANFSRCEHVGEGEYQRVAAELGITPEKPADPDRARFLVCYYTETKAPFYAALIGPAAETQQAQEGGVDGSNSQPPPTPLTLSGLPFDGNFHGPAVCGADEEYPYRWSVSLIQSDDGKVSGTIRFHKCPDGGQAIYGVSGQVTAETTDSIILQGTKRDSWGKLEDSAPEHQQFNFTPGQPPRPNLGG